MSTRRDLVTRVGAAALGWLAVDRATADENPAPVGPGRRVAFPNPTLVTHEGREVKFYDDLVRGKVVALNMMYTDCDDTCPLATSNLVRVQQLLGERVGRDVFMYSLTLQPEVDTPQRLKEYADLHGAQPGWLFLTGEPAELEQLRYALGFYDPDPAIDGDKTTHTGMVRIGNDAYDRWTSAPSLSSPEQIAAVIRHVDRSAGAALIRPASEATGHDAAQHAHHHQHGE